VSQASYDEIFEAANDKDKKISSLLGPLGKNKMNLVKFFPHISCRIKWYKKGKKYTEWMVYQMTVLQEADIFMYLFYKYSHKLGLLGANHHFGE
jgi:hypothetical protein